MTETTENSLSDSGSVLLSVPEEASGTRLDLYLSDQLKDVSRARIQKLIDSGDIVVNGRQSKSSLKLKGGEKIEIEFIPSTLDLVPENIPLNILFEDESLVVVDKPSGLVVHPGAGVRSGTLANAIAYHFQQISKKGGNLRPGIVHRLDRTTSGLIVVAKNEVAHERLSDQFQSREVFKLYKALVHGRPSVNSGKIDQPIARDPRNRTRMAVLPAGRSALSHYRVVEAFERFSLLDVIIRTGRTHQIRVHLAWIKHPVVGDTVYGGGRDKIITDSQIRSKVSSMNRNFLHAEQLGFKHPVTGEQMSFQAPLPVELEELLKFIRGGQ
jgi:23S rRNA pseudouridine1911/1915/1917 synthase